jgi:hypothetical protein
MYFDPNWIFDEMPPKADYPNVTGLMGDAPKPKKAKGFTTLSSLADVFRSNQPIQPQQPKAQVQFPTVNRYPWRPGSQPERTDLSRIFELPEDQSAGRKVAYEQQQQKIAEDKRMSALRKQYEALVQDKEIPLRDRRTIYAPTGEPINPNTDLFSLPTDKFHTSIFRDAMSSAKRYGVDPYEMLAILAQETRFGRKGWDNNPGNVIFDQAENLPDELKPRNEYDRVASALLYSNKIAPDLWQQYGITPNESDQDIWRLQAYNRYGKLTPQSSTTSRDPNKPSISSFYHIPVTEDNPLDLSKNPAYGKLVYSIMEALRNEPELQNIYKQVYEQGLGDFDSWVQTQKSN